MTPDSPLDRRLVEQVTHLWTHAQPAVRSFLFSVLREPAAVEDVMQEVALTVVRRFDRFESGTNFVGWAVTIARHKAMDYHKMRSRDRLVLDDRVVARLADAHVEIEPEIAPRRQALEACLEQVPERHRRMLAMRYEHAATPAQIAEAENMKANAVAVLLHRVRLGLRECIERRLPGERA
jgi:RNA polymerase sigma-70 factor (ECF subfamily)